MEYHRERRMSSIDDYGYVGRVIKLTESKYILIYNLYNNTNNSSIYCTLYKKDNKIYLINIVRKNYFGSNIDLVILDSLDELYVSNCVDKIFYNIIQKNNFFESFPGDNNPFNDDIIELIISYNFTDFNYKEYLVETVMSSMITNPPDDYFMSLMLKNYCH